MPSRSNTPPGVGRILHVDDDRVSREAIGEWLRCQGYQIWLAGDPEEANAVLARQDVDLILTDIHMHGNARLEWVEEILAQPAQRSVVLITGNPEFETACRAANLAVSGYLLKPPNFSELGQTVARAIAAQRQRADFLSISHEILELLSTRGAGDPAKEQTLLARLATLARQFAAQAGRESATGGNASEDPWRKAVEEAVAVIQGTKDSFRSKELGRLRTRLQQLLDSPRRGGKPPGEKG